MIFYFNQQQIQEAISSPIPDYINNLRDRDLFLKRDCFRRGKLAEIYFKGFFESYGFQVGTNIKDGNTDVDLSIIGVFLNGQNISFDRAIKIEIKTSLIPYETFNIYEQGDLKIYANSDSPINDIYWDIGIQIYYSQLKEKWEQEIVNCDYNFDLILQQYKKLNFSCSWIARNKALYYIEQLSPDDRKWSFSNSYKKFWHCPLKIHNRNIYESVIYLMSILLNEYSYKINLLQNEIQRLQNYQP